MTLTWRKYSRFSSRLTSIVTAVMATTPIGSYMLQMQTAVMMKEKTRKPPRFLQR